ncbi:translocation protein Sec62-domain-containing protein [Lipomyces tetrasporus]|uniref:Translocation protein SEC62 n=1 Tax=Lipomyces tetrasporus TaxID=54092 RepID=A0AAD7QQF2_9ASCO|nr:translocation protein Sec62-domain-containing protein [Lipomyces tetrasporus]KAJ8099423.1 translocation protein Sec62-domain-containing protein [Lipomyces tetrasporus]
MSAQPTGAPPKSPTALAIASFLRHNPQLKMRQGVLNGKRQEFFRSKRALRALQSKEYATAQKKKGSLLPPIASEEDAIKVFKELPLNSLAIRVEKLTRKTIEAKHAASPQAQLPPMSALSKVKGVPTLSFVREQVVSSDDDIYYVWLWERVHWTAYLYAGLIAAAIFTIVLFPLWPPVLRQGVWYLSMGMLGLLAAFFGMAIVRLILFAITYFAIPPGLWIFPNLFEDVGFVDSFIPLYAWNVKPEKKKKKKKATATVTAVTEEEVARDTRENKS